MHCALGKFLEGVNEPVVIDIDAPANDHPGGITEEPEVGVLDLVVHLYVLVKHVLRNNKDYIQYHQVEEGETDA